MNRPAHSHEADGRNVNLI